MATVVIPRAVAHRPVPRVAFCEFCGDPAQYSCGLQVTKLVEVASQEIEVGDEINLDSRNDDAFKVERIQVYSEGFEFLVKDYKRRLLRKYAYRGDFVMAMRLAVCGARCCELCAAERSENLHVCARHWLQHFDGFVVE